MCTGCHGGPGIERSEIGKSLNPQALDLSNAAKSWTPPQLFWIVKNGVRMTGMPAFGATHNDDQAWNIVSFIEKLLEISPEQHQELKRELLAITSTCNSVKFRFLPDGPHEIISSQILSLKDVERLAQQSASRSWAVRAKESPCCS